MKLLLNATTLTIGGGVQVATQLIKGFIENPGQDTIVFCLSPQVAKSLASLGVTPPAPFVEVFGPSPSRSRAARTQLKKYIDDKQPDAVYTIFGPAYISVVQPHVMGVADGWVTHPSRIAFSCLPTLRSRLVQCATSTYKAYWFSKADHWIVEAQVAKHGLVKNWGFPEDKIDVISNCAGSNHRFHDDGDWASDEHCHEVLVMSAPYPHKNLDLLPWVAREIERTAPALNFKIILTLPPESKLTEKLFTTARALGISRRLTNLGPTQVNDNPELYKRASVVFLPTVLETFSAVYPEAMVSGRPLITSALDFAYETCGNAAIYFTPKNPTDAASKIILAITDKATRKQMIAAGLSHVDKTIGTPDMRFRLVRKILQSCAV